MGKQRSKEGFIYIISNSNYPDYYKIGVTTNISSRLRTYQTGSPHRNFKIEYYIFHPDCYEAEQRIKQMMHYFATDIKNEWYKVSREIAIARLDEQLDVDIV